MRTATPGPSTPRPPGTRLALSRALAIAVLAVLLALAALLWRHGSALGGYLVYFQAAGPSVSPRFDALSDAMGEAALRRHFPGLALRCAGEASGPQGGVVCTAPVRQADGVPAMQLAAHFDQGRLARVVIDLPWWAHLAALRQLVAQRGAPSAIDLPPVQQRTVQWRSTQGVVTLNREPGFDPLVPGTLAWRAETSPAGTPGP